MQYIFNSSMPRSGSELLQCLLNQRNDTFASSTSPLLEYCFGAFGNLNTEEAKSIPEAEEALLGMLKYGFEGYAKTFSPSPIYCDKSRGWIHYYDMLKGILGEEPKIICMVRDIREVIASMEGLHQKNAPKFIDPQHLVLKEERAFNWLRGKPIGLAMKRINGAVQNSRNIIYVRYEDLTANPAAVMGELEEKLGIPRFQYNFNKIEKRARENEEVFGYKGIHNVKDKITPSTQKACNILGKELSTAILQECQWYQKYFNYEFT